MRGAPFAGTDRFQILSCLGAGGMGVVYRVLDRERNAEVALKTVQASRPEAIMRFKNEFHALTDLAHPNLVTLGELFGENGQWFFTMELIDGVDFLSWVRPGAPPAATLSETPLERPGPWSRRTASMGEAAMAETLPVSPASLRQNLPPLDEKRLREGLAQLCRGLSALHDAGKIHRDVKPSNVLVTPDGRVVLLDFGLATDLSSVEHQTERDVFGTTAYMAPEQAASQPVGPESDWYSVGVVLYEALTGRLPFSGSTLQVLANKQRFEPPPPHDLEANVPPDLDALCTALLRFARDRRPRGAEVQALVEGRQPPQRPSSQTSAAPFVGRQAELGTLTAAFDEVRRGQERLLLVRGESGVGKSALVRRFIESLPQESVVLQGRCYERESVPYKAFDGLMDALSRYMRRVGKAEAAAILPRRAALLVQAFPVLGRVQVFAEAPRVKQELLDPQELRSRVFTALRELFTRLAERQPLVLVIDDLQWADADSFALLGELLRPPDAPALLLLATARSGSELPLAARELTLERLPPTDALALAGALIDRAGAGVAPSLVAEEAHGHPLFIDELVRHIVAHGAAPGLRLDEALWGRVSELPTPSRRLLEAVALAGTPLHPEIAAEAAEVEPGELDKRVAQLRVANLVRSSGGRIESYHDRVREAVVAYLSPEARQALHGRLSTALEGRADAETLAEHKRGAGDRAGAARYAELAAEEAAAALAFDRAARLYRQAIELRSNDTGPLLHARLGDALAAVGRGFEAAAAYQAAAGHASVAEALDLRRRACEQLLVSGHIDEGLVVLDELLRAVGMRLPATPRGALISLGLGRARLRLRGLHFRERDSSQVAAEELMRIDLCWSVAAGLGIVDTIRGADFQTRCLLLSLRAGEPYRVARAIAMEAGFVSTGGPRMRRRTETLLSQARSLAEKVGSKHALGLTQMTGGIAAFCLGEWKQALQLGDEAQSTLRDHCTGVLWELDTSRLLSLWSLLNLGDLPEVFRRGQDHLRDARERGDHYMVTHLGTRLLQLVHLAADDVDGARRESTASLATWTRRGFHFTHFNSLAMQTQVELYAGDGARGLALLDENWPALERSLLLRIIQVQVEMRHLRGAAALAKGVRQIAASEVRALKKLDLPWAQALALLLAAGLSRSAEDFATAARAFDEAQMSLYAAAARRRQAELAGQPLDDSWMQARQIQNPARFTAMLAPLLTDK